jgi:outer membrane lipoprotein-sorting protein
MRKRIRNDAVLLSVLVFGGATAGADSLATVERDIIKKWQQHRSLKAKVTQAEAAEAKGSKAAQHGEGTYEFLRKGEAVLFREEIESAWDVKAGGRKMRFRISLLTICDGKYQYALSERVGLKSAFKTKPDPLSGADPEALFEALRAENHLKLLEETTVDDRPAYVIEARPKGKQADRSHAATLYYFSKKHGVLLKQEVRSPEGDAVQTKTYSELEFDVKIDPKRFKFQAPEGVAVQDLTRE